MLLSLLWSRSAIIGSASGSSRFARPYYAFCPLLLAPDCAPASSGATKAQNSNHFSVMIAKVLFLT
jgi:hypothetical protein